MIFKEKVYIKVLPILGKEVILHADYYQTGGKPVRKVWKRLFAFGRAADAETQKVK